MVQRSLQSIRGQGKSHESRFHFSADFILFYVENQVHTLSLTSHYYFLGSPWCSCGASFGIGLAVSISYPLLPFLEHLGLHLSLMKLRKWLVIPFKFFAEFNMPRVVDTSDLFSTILLSYSSELIILTQYSLVVYQSLFVGHTNGSPLQQLHFLVRDNNKIKIWGTTNEGNLVKMHLAWL